MSRRLTQLWFIALIGAMAQIIPAQAKGDDAKSKQFNTTNCHDSTSKMQAQPQSILPMPWCSNEPIDASPDDSKKAQKGSTTPR
jgi:hypothetical protein